MNRPRVGVQIGASTRPGDVAAIASEAEGLGYGEVWLAEDYFELGGVSSAGVALAATQRIPVGLGVVSAVARHPAVTAMEYATLGGAHPHRFMAGIGHGAPGWVRQMGLQPASPLRALREAVTAIRRLLAGDEVSGDGDYFHFDGVRLRHPPPGPVPLYLGVHGPASLRLSGELADGTVLGWFSSPGYVAWARDCIEEGRARADRPEVHELVALCVLSISAEDPVDAKQRIAGWATPMLTQLAASPQLTASSEGAELLAHFEREGHDGNRASQIPEPLLGRFVAAGNIADCADTVADLLEAGADRVVLVPNPAGYLSTGDMVEQMRTASSLTRTQWCA